MGDLGEWFRNYMWAVWGVGGLALAALELFTLDLTLLMLACGAFAGALTAVLFPSLVWLQVVVALAVAVSTLLLLRPTLLARVRSAPGYRSSVESLVGSPGRVTAQIARDAGEVKVHGQVWDARSFDPDVTIQEGEPVEVYGIDGITLIVYPTRTDRELDGPG